MSETIRDKTVFSLYEVTKSIQKTLAERYKNAFWVKAEMNKLNWYSHSGHCYPELVEKRDGKVIAQMKSHMWKTEFEKINNEFLRVLKEPLKDGIKILFYAKITFDPAYGISIHILDIDPAYTLGDLEKEKQETIQKLKEEGKFDKNKHLKLPLLPSRIAIISVETSKGYADFVDVISNNPWNYKIFHMLFPSLLQGEKAVSTIIAQLKRIKKVKTHFDAVAIIRGGGGDIGLSCYNNYKLAKEIADFPLPVLTGIGHSTNETVSELIAFENAITPTKLAEYIIQIFHNFSIPVNEAKEIIDKGARRILTDSEIELQKEIKEFIMFTYQILRSSKVSVDQCSRAVQLQSAFRVRTEKELLFRTQEKLNERCNQLIKNSELSLAHLEKNVSNLSPMNILKRGFSITQIDGKSVRNAADLTKGDKIHTILFEGSINSTIHSIYPNKSNE